jgi:hypothetical protein
MINIWKQEQHGQLKRTDLVFEILYPQTLAAGIIFKRIK